MRQNKQSWLDKKIDNAVKFPIMRLNDVYYKVFGHRDYGDLGLEGRIHELQQEVNKLKADRDLLLGHLGLTIKTIEKHDEISKS
jgi:hypothetical protein